MKVYLSSHHPGVAAGGSLPAVAQTYLATVLLPSMSGSMGQRDERELRTIAKAIDLLVSGDSAGAGDVLMQRFKAVETASADGHWSIAKHMELLPTTTVSAVTDREREVAARMEKEERKLKARAKGQTRY